MKIINKVIKNKEEREQNEKRFLHMLLRELADELGIDYYDFISPVPEIETKEKET